MLNDREYMSEPEPPAPSITDWRDLSAVTVILLLTIGVFVFQATTSTGSRGFQGGLTDYLVLTYPSVLDRQIWRFVTSIFAHADPMHIFFNMFGLWMFGRELERKLGRQRFYALYFASGLLGNLVWLGWNMAPTTSGPVPALLGASGAVLGVVAAAAYYFPGIKVLAFFIIPMSIRTFAIGFAAFSIVMNVTGGMGNVAHLAHLGGMVGGIALAYAWRNSSDRRRQRQGRVRQVDFRGAHDRGRPDHGPDLGYRIPDDKEKVPAGVAGDPLLDVDPILDKIGKQGLKSLTRSERELLEKAGRHWKQEDR